MLPELAAAGPPRAGADAHQDVLCVHGTCVALGGRGVLLRGRSGAGKSDLALRLIDHGAALVADDQVLIERHGGSLAARAPLHLQGLIEVRGIGILRIAAEATARLALVVELTPRDRIDRLPDTEICRLLDVPLAMVRIDPAAPSAAAVVRLAVSAERVG